MKGFWVKFPRICWFNLLVFVVVFVGAATLLAEIFLT